MDGFKEKKWFVYLVDHHEGPFALEEIQQKLAQGQLTRTSYVWADGMVDWKMMSDVEVFETLLLPYRPGQDRSIPALTMPTMIAQEPLQPVAPVFSSTAASAIGGMALHTPDTDPVHNTNSSLKIQPQTATLVSSNQAARGDFSITNLQSIPLAQTSYANGSFGSPEVADKKPRRRLKTFLKFAVVLLIIALGGFAYIGGYLGPLLNSDALRNSGKTINGFLDPLLITLSEKAPFLGAFISPIPQLQDVDKEEFDGLKAAARMKLDMVGPQLALALSKADLSSPTFYASSNLPNGATFDIYVEGISETLLNQLSFSAKGQVVINKHLGVTAPLKSLDGKPFPRGQYIVMAVDTDNQPAEVKTFSSRFQAVSPEALPPTIPKSLKIISFKSYFLGGTKDSSYTSRLKEFHDKLTAKATAEMVEIKQFAATLDMQYGSTVSKFASLKRGAKITPGQKKTWAIFDQQWMALMGQLSQSFVQLTPESIKNDYFYGTLYQASQQTSQAVSKLHEIQNGVYNSTVDPKSAEIQLGEASAIAQSAVNELKSKIAYVDKLPPKPNGMPNRDGL